MNKVVARFNDGRILKGVTADFVPAKDVFHLSVAGAPTDARALEVELSQLKALFFVKDYAGDPNHAERNYFDASHPPLGRQIRVEFNDGEVLVGTTQGYRPERPGFFLEPADADSNIERCWVVASSIRDVRLL